MKGLHSSFYTLVAIGLAMTKVFIINKRPYGGIAQTLAAFLERRCLPLQKAAFFIKTSQELGLHLNDSTFQSDL